MANDAMERFFGQIQESGALPEDKTPEDAATAALCVLARRIPTGEAVHVLGTFPAALRTRFRVCMLHIGAGAESFNRERFLRLLAEHLDVDEGTAEDVARAVFGAVHTQFGNPALDELEGLLPDELKDLWRGAARGPRVGAPSGHGQETAQEAPHERAHRSEAAPASREKRSGRPEWETREPPEVKG